MLKSISLASSTATRIGQLMRLLSSDRAGEVVAAASAINRTLAVAGRDIHHLADTVEQALVALPPPRRQQQRQPRRPRQEKPPSAFDDATTIINFCRRHAGRLTERDVEFIASLDGLAAHAGPAFNPTAKQWSWLLDILDRLTRTK